MHRDVLDVPNDLVVDHINHNGLDNRKENLRICTKGENAINRVRTTNRFGKELLGRFKGTCLSSGNVDTWRARLRHNGSRYFLGTYNTELEAAYAYNLKAREVFGEFAHLNEFTKDEQEWLNVNFELHDKKPIKNVWHKTRSNKWEAGIQINNHHIHIGTFATEAEGLAAVKKFKKEVS